MISIKSTVGRGGVNDPTDVFIVQGLINQQRAWNEPPVLVDCKNSPSLEKLIESYQSRNRITGSKMGVISPGDPAWQLLSVIINLPESKGSVGLSDVDFRTAQVQLGCELEAIYAVAQVESKGAGFLPSGRPKILFEAHRFGKYTAYQYNRVAPDISCTKEPEGKGRLYIGGEMEYDRLAKAMCLNRVMALKSASYGRFQIMGDESWRTPWPKVEMFVAAMFQSERNHLNAFISFVISKQLRPHLVQRDWYQFARGYNGLKDGHIRDFYDLRLEQQYESNKRTMQIQEKQAQDGMMVA